MRCRGLDASDATKFLTTLRQNALKHKVEDLVPTGFHQRKKSNKDQKLHDELNVDIEPLVDTLVQIRAQLRELEPSIINLPSFYQPQKYFVGFYL